MGYGTDTSGARKVEVSRKNLPLGLGSVDNMNPFSVMARLAQKLPAMKNGQTARNDITEQGYSSGDLRPILRL